MRREILCNDLENWSQSMVCDSVAFNRTCCEVALVQMICKYQWFWLGKWSNFRCHLGDTSKRSELHADVSYFGTETWTPLIEWADLSDRKLAICEFYCFTCRILQQNNTMPGSSIMYRVFMSYYVTYTRLSNSKKLFCLLFCLLEGLLLWVLWQGPGVSDMSAMFSPPSLKAVWSIENPMAQYVMVICTLGSSTQLVVTVYLRNIWTQ